jgi:all-trans-retinol dehydrogenase (NAD+)
VRGARVLVTGAASGMGRLFAQRAVLEDAASVVLWDRDRAALTDTVTELELLADGGTAVYGQQVDLAEMGGIAQAAQRVRREIGNPDVLINNAGVVSGGNFWEHNSGDDTRVTMQVNALAPMYATREFLPGMIANAYRPARIVTMASAAGLVPAPRMSVYAASKSAVIGWSEALRLELEREDHGNVRVTTVLPAFVTTGMFDGVRAPRLTPTLDPEYVVDRVWAAMLAGRPTLLLPRSVALAKVLKGVLPSRAFDAVAGALGVHGTMTTFRGRG